MNNGRIAGRRRPHLPQLERVGTARGFRSDAVLRAEPEPAEDSRQLRVAPGRPERSEYGVAGPPDARRQPWLPDGRAPS